MLRGYITLFYLFDVGDAIDLEQIQTETGATVASPFTPRPATPEYLQYLQPPLILDGPSLGLLDVGDVAFRIKVFDYGVISIALNRPLPRAWEQMIDAGCDYRDHAPLAELAEQRCRDVLQRIGTAVTKPRTAFLSEDYVVFVIHPDAADGTAEQLLTDHGETIAQLLRAERETLSPQEKAEVLRHRISYLSTDVVIPTWSCALIYDTDVGAQAAIDLLEFANSQLLEFRYYDRLLDDQLARIYAELQTGGWLHNRVSRRHARAARHVHALFIDVNELTDKTENALKIAGDVYAARLFNLTAARLGLDQWKGNVREKLKTLDDIYRFAVEYASAGRAELLELVIVILILLEIVLFLWTGMH